MIDADVHLRRVVLADLVEARPMGVPVLDTWDTVQEIAERLGLTDELRLFARPSVTRQNGVASGEAVWYGSVVGAVLALGLLEPAEREKAEADLARGLDRLQPLLHDAGAGPLFAAWFNIPSLDDDVLLVGNQPIITNWGFLPAATAASAAGRRHHFQRGIARLVPHLLSEPPFGSDEHRAAAAAPAKQWATTDMRAAPSGESVTEHAAQAVRSARTEPAIVYSRPWLPVAIATGIAAFILILLMLPGVLVYPSGAVTERRPIDPDLLFQTRKALEQRLQELQARLREPDCPPASTTTTTPRPGGTVTPQDPNGTGQHTAPTNPTTPANPTNPAAPTTPTNPPATQPLVPPTLGNLAVPQSNGNHPSNLIAHLDSVTALIIAPQANGSGASFGTGFFVNDHQLVTNRHVIENANAARILVVNKIKGRAVQGHVAASTTSSEIGGDDFAVVEVEAEQGHPFMTLTNRVERGDLVIAAGYPTFVMRNDIGFQRLLENSDLSAVPDPAVTQGWVTALQTSEHRTPILVHGATISKGNSGGPLSDMCGRAVGVNTYGDVDPETALRLNFALRTEGLRRFLDAKHITYASDDADCVPSDAAHASQANQPGPPNVPAAAPQRDQPGSTQSATPQP